MCLRHKQGLFSGYTKIMQIYRQPYVALPKAQRYFALSNKLSKSEPHTRTLVSLVHIQYKSKGNIL